MAAFCDADFAGDLVTSKSTSGMLIMLSSGPVQWKSQTQKIVTLSSTEAELVSLCSAIKEVVWLRKLGLELQIIDPTATKVYCDNQSTIRVALNERSSHRTRHIAVRAAYPREKIEDGNIDVTFVKSQHQLADMLTKGQEVKNFFRHRNQLVCRLSLFTTVITILVLMCVVNSHVLTRTDPVIWKQTNKVVFGQRVEFKILFLYLNPCNEFTGYEQHPPHGDAKKQCNSLFQSEWVNNMVLDFDKLGVVYSLGL